MGLHSAASRLTRGADFDSVACRSVTEAIFGDRIQSTLNPFTAWVCELFRRGFCRFCRDRMEGLPQSVAASLAGLIDHPGESPSAASDAL